jgi:AmmeMemoRadiSam system protein A
MILTGPAQNSASGKQAESVRGPCDHETHSKGHGETKMTDLSKLNESEGKQLLSLARKTIEERLYNQGEAKMDLEDSSKFHEKRGTFVTLTKQGNLRGCIGHIIPQDSLLEDVRANAINAAFQDPRFRPVSKEEWNNVRIEISILTHPKPLPYSSVEGLLEKLRPHTDGVIIRKSYHQAVFLPQVWEQLPNKEDFLAHLCLKAGLTADAWKKGDLEVSIFQVQAFEEE